MSEREHWQRVYESKPSDAVSWFQAEATLSLDLIRRIGAPREAAIIDVGGGASTLVDGLLAEGFGDLTVLDLSDAALRVARNRLGARGEEVRWIAGDITGVDLPEATYDVWHDRAVFHFLTTAEARRAYVRQVMKAVRHGGHVIVATFAADGPTECSGLPVMRYDADELHAEFGSAFQLTEHRDEHHVTPAGTGPALRLLPLPETPVKRSVAGLRSARPAMRTTFHDIRHFFFGPRPDKLPSRGKPLANQRGRQSRPVAWPDFKSGGGRQPFLGGFDSHCLPPILRSLSAAIVSHRIKRLSRSVPAEAASHPSPSSP